MAIPTNCNRTKNRIFLDNPASFSYTPNPSIDPQESDGKIEADYRDQISKITKQIIQSNSDHFSVIQQNMMHYSIKTGKVPYGLLKLSVNLLGIHSVSECLLKTKVQVTPDLEPLIVETGNHIYQVLKENQLSACYFQDYGRIIVESSSSLSAKELQQLFERYSFQTGFYPIVDEERTKFNDLTIHLSDEPAPRIAPFIGFNMK